jgi:hypothetical protein
MKRGLRWPQLAARVGGARGLQGARSAPRGVEPLAPRSYYFWQETRAGHRRKAIALPPSSRRVRQMVRRGRGALARCLDSMRRKVGEITPVLPVTSLGKDGEFRTKRMTAVGDISGPGEGSGRTTHSRPSGLG